MFYMSTLFSPKNVMLNFREINLMFLKTIGTCFYAKHKAFILIKNLIRSCQRLDWKNFKQTVIWNIQGHEQDIDNEGTYKNNEQKTEL